MSAPAASSLERERRAREIFDAAVELAADDQAAYLARVGAGDPELQKLVAELLAADGGSAAGELAAEAWSGGVARSVLAAFERASFESHIGKQVGPYRLEAFLGAGGMGAVYLGRRQQGFVMEVAIKLLRPGPIDAAAAFRFERERQLLASLDHPLIARLLDGGVSDDGLPYLVMERIRGLPITHHADQQKLGIEARIELVIASASAVAHAHRRLIVHRDLKPSNLLIDEEGRPKLLDFGIAKVLEGSPFEHEPLTATGSRPLTPGYASPEQFTGQSLGTASDQYSLAALTFELLVGRTPLPAGLKSWEELAEFYRQSAPPSLAASFASLDPAAQLACGKARSLEPAQLRKRLDDDLERILAKALARDVEDRYPTIEAFAADLDAWRRGRPVAARKPTFFYRSRKFCRRNKLLATLGALSCLLAAFLLFREWRSSRELAAERDAARLEQHRAEKERTRSRAVARFLVELFGEADPRRHGGRALSVEELLERGARAAEAQQAVDAETRALLLTAIADAEQNLGALDPATQLYRRALELRQPAAGASDSESRLAFAAALDALGKNERLSGRFAEAENASRAALEIHREERDTPAEALAENLDNLAEALHELGRLDEAEAPYLEALALRRQRFGDRSELVAESLDHFALLERNRGRFAAANRLYREALAIRQQILPAGDPAIAETLHVIGMLEHDQGHLDLARQALEEALAALRRAYQPPHPLLALCLNDLGMLEIDLHLDAAAEAHLREAVAQRRRLYSGDHPELVQSLGGLGGLLARGGRFGEAETLLGEALTRALRLFGENHVYVAITRQHLADLWSRRGRFEQALNELERALEILRVTLGQDHPVYWRAKAQHALMACRAPETRSAAAATAALDQATAALARLLGDDHPEVRALRLRICGPPA